MALCRYRTKGDTRTVFLTMCLAVLLAIVLIEGSLGRTSYQLFRQFGGVVTYRRIEEPDTMIKPLNVTRIMYNRVPKCGSRTVELNIKKKRLINYFHRKSMKVYTQYSMSEDIQRTQIDTIMNYTTPLVYDGHFHYINFTRFGREQPAYINVVRDPLERMASFYYFIRFDHPRPMNKTRRNRTFDKCVKLSLPECVSDHEYFQIVPFFCGQDDFCRVPSERALQVAKYNVVHHYAVVGVTEDLAAFFRVLQYRFPRFFKGSEQLYWKNEEALRNETKSSKKKPLYQSTRARMQPLLKYDNDFYYFVKQRFYEQLKQLNDLMYPRNVALENTELKE